MTAWTRLLEPDAVAVFLFHGVVATARDNGIRNYTGKHIPLAEFEGFLDELLAAGRPIALPELAGALEHGKPLPPGAFAVTFDDGFANNLTVAAPALEARSVPAAFYVTTGFVDENRASWIDRIEFAVARSEVVRLDLPFLPGGAEYRTRAEKVALLDAVRRAGKSDPTLDPDELADSVWTQLDVSELDPDPELDRKLTWDEVRALDRHELFTVGGHGATHRILEYLPQAELETELDTCLRRLHSELGRDVAHFSYPEGLAGTYSQRTAGALSERGVRCAVAAEGGVVRHGADLLALSRILVA